MLEAIRKALVLAPHPDDEVLGCGGTIAHIAKVGGHVHVGIVTRADGPGFPPDTVAIGRREAAAAHGVLGVRQTHYLDQPAVGLDMISGAELNRVVGELVESLAPDTLFVPFLGDVHVDHQRIFQAAMVAVRPRSVGVPVRVLAYETLSETNWYAPGITPAFVPDTFIDIGETIETKLRAFACFASQVREFPDERSLRALEAQAVVRGATVFRRAAEAFMTVRQIW